MGLQRTHRGDDDGGIGHQAGHPALDVEEPLGAHVRPEAGFGDEEVAGVDPDLVGHDRGVAVGDVPEWAGMHQDGGVLQGLEQVGLQRVAHDHGHGPGPSKIFGSDRAARGVEAHHDGAESAAHVGQRGGEGKDRHHFGGCRDVESGLAGDPVLRGT